MEALHFAVTVRAQPAGDVVACVAGEVRTHVDQTGGHCGSGGGESERGQRPKRCDPEERAQRGEAEPDHLCAEGLSWNRATQKEDPGGDHAARRVPFAISRAIRRLAGDEHAEDTATVV